MDALSIIEKKRDGEVLTQDEIEFFFWEYTAERIPEYQAAALCMAIYFQGMNVEETRSLTLAMAASGDQLDLHGSVPPGTVIVDKHSSGGVGDKTTLVAGPIAAALGLPVAKMTGRGLSYSGGTIDKMESITGWSSEVSEEKFRRQLQETGFVLAGQTRELAPADGKLYALRDVIGAVPSLPLIAASIMSKKIAAGSDAIVLDVKAGSGTFMKDVGEAKVLANLMVDIGKRVGRGMSALISNMEQPLGRAIGNALEVKEAVESLRGNGPSDFMELIYAVVTELLWQSEQGKPALPDEIDSEMAPPVEGFEQPTAEDRARIDDGISSGAALDKFKQLVEAQGGQVKEIDRLDRLPLAPVIQNLEASSAGWVEAINAKDFGMTCVELGGGRKAKNDRIDHRVGIVIKAKVGDEIDAGQPLLELHAANNEDAVAALVRLSKATKISESPVEPLPVIHGRFR